ncbi:hypothetical protein BDZ90DRAFT_34855 [Jaminaea rosea]|uniref:VOC domain-containing protein n=1 Tax=Jaminaea rosea TaxID=1569628 RepID=A0A316V3I1_9BASI|nr:hypothetical protein BDZ90DRAFT_34855 [Jaminaea rosea]PWN31091.1 hypothetical protein BDZ90DRAFT_34855 [Jaminaea rosea]
MAPTASFATPLYSSERALNASPSLEPTTIKKARIVPPSATTASLLIPPAPEIIDGRCVWHWQDKHTIAEGWIVIDAPQPTAAGGGLFLHEQASLTEVRDVACAMSTKLAVSSQPQIVGAKGGIRFSHRDPEATHVLERFIRDNAAVISTYWGTGGDLNTSHSLIDEYAKKYCTQGTETALDALSRALQCPTSAKDVPRLLQESVPTPAGVEGVEWSLEEYSVGYVMAVTLKRMLEKTDPALIGRARLVVQGFGCVGATFAQAAQELGLGRIVGISSQYGFLCDNSGIDVAAINKARRSSPDTTVDPNSLEAGLTAQQRALPTYTRRKTASTDEDHLVSFLTSARADVFVPCACRYILTPKVTAALVSHTFSDLCANAQRYVVAGANNVFPATAQRSACLAKLDEAGITMMPEWVSNSGTANLFMRTCSGLALQGRPLGNLAACARDTTSFIDAVFSRVGGSSSTSTALWHACDEVASARRQAGAINLLGVERISHLTLISPDAKRSKETFLRVGNVSEVVSVEGGADLFRLPGIDDPTLSIEQAPADAGPADTGLHVRFAVANLEKARRVLAKQNVAFTERPITQKGQEGDFELELTGEQAGYPMSFCQSAEPSASSSASLSSPSAAGPTTLSNGLELISHALVSEVKQLDHYTLIVPDASAVREFHERMLGYTHLRTITLNAGAAPEGEEDMLNHVMALPFDTQRVLVITEGLIPESIFSKLLQKKRRPYVHHIALQVGDVEAAFAGVRGAGWQTTSDKISKDMLSGLRQFFLREEEAGCFLELIERSDGPAEKQEEEAEAPVAVEAVEQAKAAVAKTQNDESSNAKGQGEFRRGNMASLAQSMESYVKG